MRIATAISAAGLATGLALTGAHVASAGPASSTLSASPVSAASSTPGSITLPDGSVLEERVANFCNRVPALIQRVDQAETRITGGATTKGSLTWLKARQAKATANHHPRIAGRVGRRIERRTARLAKLPGLKVKLATASNECATLDLPAPSSSPSPSANS